MIIELLSGHSLTVARRISAASMSLTLQRDSKSSGEIKLQKDDPGINTGDWFRFTTPQNETIVMRCSSLSVNSVTGERTVNLEHLIATLDDSLIFSDVTTETIAGTTGATKVTPAKVLDYILDQQTETVWTAGTCAFTTKLAYTLQKQSLTDALSYLTDTLEDSYLTFDFSSFPFTLNIAEQPTEVTCAMNKSRNISLLNVTIDRTGMFTRLYPLGYENLELAEKYVSRHEGTYGIISKTQQNQSCEDETTLRAWAKHELKRHAEPAVTAQITGAELYSLTGEPMDRLLLATRCRVPVDGLPDPIESGIVTLKWNDIIAQPNAVVVTLSNARKTTSSVIASLQNASRRGGAGAGKQQAEIKEWTTETQAELRVNKDNIKDIVVGIGFKLNPDGTIALDTLGYPIHNPNDPNQNSVFNISDRHYNHWDSTIGVVVNRVDAVSEDVDEVASSVDTIIGSTIWQTKDNITNFVGQWNVELDEHGEKKLVIKSGGGIVIEREHTQYGLFDEGTLTAGVIATKVNGVPSTYIQGENIYIGNEKSTTVINGKCSLSDVTANYISTKIASLSTLGVNHLNAEQIAVDGNLVWHEGNASDVVTAIACTVNQSTGQVRLQWSTADGNPGDVTFSRATTPTLSGSWSGGVVTVSSNPAASRNYQSSVYMGAVSWSGNVATGNIMHSEGSTEAATGATYRVDATARYNAGRQDATLTASGWSNGTNKVTNDYNADKYVNVSVPSINSYGDITLSASDTGTSSKTCTATLGGTTRSHALSIDASAVYTAGHNDGYDDGYDDGAKSIKAANIIPPVTDISKASYTAPSTSHKKGQYTAHFTIDRILIDGTHNQNTYGSSSTLTFDADAAYDEGYDEGYDKGYKKCAGEGPKDFRSGAVGTNCGTVARSSTGYITMTVGSYNYYIKVT